MYHLSPGSADDPKCNGTSFPICMHCDRIVDTEAIECSNCNTWYHYICENLSQETFDSPSHDPASTYECMSCALNRSNSSDPMMHPVGSSVSPVALSGSNTQTVSYATQTDSQLATISKDTGEPLTSPHTGVDNQGIDQNPHILPSSTIALEHSQIPDPITISPLLCVSSAGAAAASVTHCVTRPFSSPIVLPINSASYTNHVDTITVDADESETSLKDQMLKSKEKSLSNKERRLKELEKKLNNKEISLSDQLDQNEFSKTYIVSMENKV